MQLTPHFTLAELCASSKATQLRLNNTPPPELLPRLIRLAEMLERVRTTLGVPVTVTSGYRGESLERELTYASYLSRCRLKGVPVNENTWKAYFAGKDHPQGHAADIVAPGFGSPHAVATALAPLVSTLGIGQLILEGVKGKQWVHLSTRVPDKLANRVITITDAGAQVGIQVLV